MMILEEINKELANNLEDIIHKIEIGDNFYLQHQDYPSVEITSEMKSKLQQLPADFQERYWTLRLSNYIEDIYFHGCTRTINLGENGPSLPLENNFIKGVDRGFYQQLKTNNYGKGYFDPDWLIVKEKNDGILAVTKNGLTFEILRDRHLKKSDIAAKINDLVAIKLPHNRWQDHFYVAISELGLIDDRQQTLELYFNVNPDGAILLLNKLTQQLNQLKIIFTLKILDEPNKYPAYDAVILNIYSYDYFRVANVIKNLYSHLKLYLHPETPICTFKLANGIGLAETHKIDFADSRCSAIAFGLLTAWYEENNSPHYRLKCIEQEFLNSQIDLKHPYINHKKNFVYQQLI